MIIKSKDLASFLVVFEDGATVAGLIVVILLMGISHTFKSPESDGPPLSLLVSVYFILASESRNLLMVEGIEPETREKIAILREKDVAVVRTKNN
ncbi:hypothetical protein PQ459_13995 [Chryseobacterium sp. KACC 21268]|nr:hypothetical protein PQ459_13995 [Chryseobacterium sp. KACC 21268]